MNPLRDDDLRLTTVPTLREATMVMSFSGWMDGGDVSTGTVKRMVELLHAKPIGEIDYEPFYVLNFPGSMEIASLFRPQIKIEDGMVRRIEMPSNKFYCAPQANLVLFVGREPHMHWGR